MDPTPARFQHSGRLDHWGSWVSRLQLRYCQVNSPVGVNNGKDLLGLIGPSKGVCFDWQTHKFDPRRASTRGPSFSAHGSSVNRRENKCFLYWRTTCSLSIVRGGVRVVVSKDRLAAREQSPVRGHNESSSPYPYQTFWIGITVDRARPLPHFLRR